MVSICIPAYNNPQCIERLLESIKRQSYQDIEIIITDDSDNDETEKVIAEKYTGMRIIYRKNNNRGGAAKNCNFAMNLATGNFIKIMHQDDWFADLKSLERLVEGISRDPDMIFYSCGTYQIGDRFKYQRSVPVDKLLELCYNYKLLYKANYIGAPSATIFKNTTVRFDERLRWLVDLEFYMRLLQNGQMGFTDEPLICIGMHKGQETQKCSNNKGLIKKEYTYVFNKHKLNKNWMCIKKLINVMISGKG